MMTLRGHGELLALTPFPKHRSLISLYITRRSRRPSRFMARIIHVLIVSSHFCRCISPRSTASASFSLLGVMMRVLKTAMPDAERRHRPLSADDDDLRPALIEAFRFPCLIRPTFRACSISAASLDAHANFTNRVYRRGVGVVGSAATGDGCCRQLLFLSASRSHAGNGSF